MHALTTWWERRKYKRALKANMAWLLIQLPRPMFKQILASYPGINSSADAAFENGTNINEESVRVVATVVADVLLRGLSSATRQQIISSLRGGAHAPETDSVAALWSTIIKTMEGQTHAMALAGKIDARLRDMLMSEVIGALDGQSPEERSQRRMFRAVDDALLPKA